MTPTTERAPRVAWLLAGALLGAACAGPGDWWQQDLQEWQGAPVSEVLEAWGPPVRTLTGPGTPGTLVFESVRELDYRLERLRDPAARLDPDRGAHTPPPAERSECLVYFEIEADTVARVRSEGAACNIVPRDPARRRVDPAPARNR
jgi:hypothetical protein